MTDNQSALPELPMPVCTYADHSYPAYTKAQMLEYGRRCMAGLQPMSTAPRDGTIVDLWLRGGFRLTDLWWVPTDDSWCGHEEDLFVYWSPIPGYGPPDPDPANEALNEVRK
jgi:hypothetical protein